MSYKSLHFFKDTCTVFHFAALNPCSSFPCLNNGRCIPKGDGFVCACQSGFSGRICDHGKLDKYNVLCSFCQFYFNPSCTNFKLCPSLTNLGINLSQNVSVAVFVSERRTRHCLVQRLKRRFANFFQHSIPCVRCVAVNPYLSECEAKQAIRNIF